MHYLDFTDTISQAFPFWNELSENDKNYLLENSAGLTYKKGRNVHNGNECTGLILVRRGCLRIYMLSEEGREITLYRLNSGGMCMLSASCVIKSITFDVFVDAEEDSDCIVISGGAFADLSERVPSVKIFALEATVSRFSEVMWVMQQILFMSVDRRLANFLLDEASKTGDDMLKLTHEQIAKYIGSAREVVSRMLKYFSSEGVIESSRGGIRILDKAGLERLAL